MLPNAIEPFPFPDYLNFLKIEYNCMKREAENMRDDDLTYFSSFVTSVYLNN